MPDDDKSADSTSKLSVNEEEVELSIPTQIITKTFQKAENLRSSFFAKKRYLVNYF